MASMIDADILACLDDAVSDSDPAVATEPRVESDDLVGRSSVHRARERTCRVRKARVEKSTNFDPAVAMLSTFFAFRYNYSTVRNTAYHYSCDAACIGAKDRLVGFLTAAGHPGAWLPTQAAGVPGSWVRTTSFFPQTKVRSPRCT